MANNIEYTQKEISNNQGNKVVITIIRGVFEKNVDENRRHDILEKTRSYLMKNKPHKLLKDEEYCEYLIIEGENELDFTDITKEVTSC